MTLPQLRHLSPLELDLYFASAAEGDPARREIERHLEGCPACQQYLAALQELDALPPRPIAPPLPIPARGPRLGWIISGAGALALAAGIALVGPRGTGDLYVAQKGAPAAQVLLRSDGRTRIWNGRDPVHAGDALAFRVACEGFARVTVATAGATPERPTRVFEGACPTDAQPLPFSLVVDDAPGAESVAVILSHDPLDDRALGGAVAGAPKTKSVWALPFVLTKTEGGKTP
jgi:hypothetical protein